MKLKIITLVFCLLFPALSSAADDVEAILNKALERLVKNMYVGDTSAAEGYLQAVLQREPNHIEARWQLLYVKLVPLQNSELLNRSTELAAISPEFARLAKLAKESGKLGFLHFASAVYATFYHAYERAVSEIDQALALEPKSARYLTAKGRILAGYGKWTKRDEKIEEGISSLKKAREMLRAYPSSFVRDENFDFYLAYAISDLSRPRWEEVIDHYLRFIERFQDSAADGFAWNNLSAAYRHSGQCLKAKEAAEKAKGKFGGAQFNLRLAEFCIEMQKMGIMAQDGAAAPLAVSTK